MGRAGLPSFLALLLLCLPRLAAAQAVLTLTPQDCVYRQGDDLAWASPTLDDSAWQLYSHWHADLSHPRLWICCHANLSGLLSVSQPALQVRLYGPYELYLDGRERLHYDRSDPENVVLTTTDSNVWEGASGHTYTFTRRPNGSTDI